MTCFGMGCITTKFIVVIVIIIIIIIIIIINTSLRKRVDVSPQAMLLPAQ